MEIELSRRRTKVNPRQRPNTADRGILVSSRRKDKSTIIRVLPRSAPQTAQVLDHFADKWRLTQLRTPKRVVRRGGPPHLTYRIDELFDSIVEQIGTYIQVNFNRLPIVRQLSPRQILIS